MKNEEGTASPRHAKKRGRRTAGKIELGRNNESRRHLVWRIGTDIRAGDKELGGGEQPSSDNMPEVNKMPSF